MMLLLLHYLPRFQAESPVMSAVTALLGQPPVKFAQFVAANRAVLRGKGPAAE